MKVLNLLLIVVIVGLLSACGREFLDVKRQANQVIPKTTRDFLALMDLNSVMNRQPSVVLGIVGGDEYFLQDGRRLTLSDPYARGAYIWSDDVYGGREVQDWNNAYHRILYANLAMEIDKVIPTADEQEDWNLAKGMALFHRGYNYFQLAQLFCKPYDKSSAATDLGVPLRLEYDVTVRLGRGNVSDLYDQIVSDLKEAIELLPAVPQHTFRPGKAAACAILARTYLQMREFDKAGEYAALGLRYQSGLLDFNTLDLEREYTFDFDYGVSNPEVLFFWHCVNIPAIAPARFNVDTALLASYDRYDLRYEAYFYPNGQGETGFKGSYTGDQLFFAGITTSELWLIRAECDARRGEIHLALSALNKLRENRMKKGHFVPLETTDPDHALAMILLERRKELFARGVRWEDIRRLNHEERFSKALERRIDGEQYFLPPNDLRWVWPLPDSEVEINGFPNNPR